MSLEYQIMLIPQDRYWEWVQAVRDYVLHYGITMTPDRESAGCYRDEPHVVTVIDFPGAWPDDIADWFRVNHPSATLDLIKAGTPNTLVDLLAERVARDDRFGRTQGDFKLAWPTDFPVITQPFGANPQYYRRFGLPGHEGVDIRALMNTPIYSSAAGHVYLVREEPGSHAYGIHIRIRHLGGYKTIYAHLSRALVKVGDEVEVGERIGLADSTGNSSASHLHLTLKKEGATERGETPFPSDIIDPTPFLLLPGEGEVALRQEPPWEPGVCLVGVHGRTDGPLVDKDYPTLQTAKVEAIKLIVNAQPDNVDRIRAINPDCFFLARLFADFGNGRVVPAAEFARWQIDDMRRLYDKGVRYFEVHNEPNLTMEGFGANWRNGDGFEAWFLEVVSSLKSAFPEAKFGFPGCSPGQDASGVRQDMWRFLEQCETAIAEADWIGVHCYWRNEAEMLSSAGGLGFQEYQRRWPDKLFFITEFSNPSPQVDMQTKGRQYVQFFRILRHRPGFGAAFCFVLSASTGMSHETWRHEDGRTTAIPALIGGRGF